jgi:prolyl-tRNA synthetase
MPDGRVLQLPSTHNLGQHFAKAFNIKYTDAKGESQFAWQTCYGPAISRIYAGVIATHGDDKGLILPFSLAPIQLVIVPIYKGENQKKVNEYCEKMVAQLTTAGFSVKFDDSDNTPGFKYNQWEMKGIPLRVEAGERDIEKNSVVVVRRDSREKAFVAITDLVTKIKEIATAQDAALRKKADDWFKGMLKQAGTMAELNTVLEKDGGLVRIPFCTDAMEGEKCADKVKNDCKANVRGSLYGSKEKPKGEKCVACGHEAKIYLYAARQY